MRQPSKRFSVNVNYQKARWIIVVLGASFLGVLLYAYLHFSELNALPSLRNGIAQIIAAAFIAAVTGVTLLLFNRLLDRWLPLSRFFAARFLLGYLTNTILASGIILGAVWLIGNSADSGFWGAMRSSDADLQWKIAILVVVIVFIYQVVYALLYSYNHYAVTQVEQLQRERKQLELQFEALKSQISPHYLFNALNTISSLLFRDLPSAEQFIRRLAQYYQYILSTQQKNYVTLREEVEGVQSYYYLLRIRFQQQLQIEINLPSGIMESKIPPLTLQLLIENAVKHNQLATGKSLLIYITAQDNQYLKVINTKTNTVNSVESFRIGLENIRKRYEYFTDRKIEVRDEEKFTVSLPVLRHGPEVVAQKYSA